MIRLKSAALCAAAVATALGAMAFAPAPAAPAPESKIVVTEVSRDGYNRRVRIHNQTGWTMLRFYASDSRKDDWEEDILGDDVLENGQNVRINIDDGSGACIYDFKAQFTNGQELTRFRINVCEVSEYTYTR